MNIPPTQELLVFQKVATHLSFRKAAEDLNLDASTVSYLIRSLEDRLELRLLNRTTRSVALTEAGENLLAGLAPILLNLVQTIDTLHEKNRKPSGLVRINLSEMAARIFMREIQPKLKAKFPDIQLELFIDDRLTDIVSTGFDAGVRLREMVPEDMVAIPLGKDFRFVAVASPGYIKKFGELKNPKDLLEHNCLRYRFQSGRLYSWEFEKRGQQVEIDVNGSITLNYADLMIETALKGLGIAYVAESVIKEQLESKKLVVLLSDWSVKQPGLYLYYPKNRHAPPALRALVDTLKELKGQ